MLYILIVPLSGHVIIDNVESVVPDYQLHRFARNVTSKLEDLPRNSTVRPQLLVWSAHDKATLKRNIEQYGKVANNFELLDVSYTLAHRRSLLAVRAFAVCREQPVSVDFVNAVQTIAENKKPATIAFVFTGEYTSSASKLEY